MEIKTPYQLSTDYEALYNLLQDGSVLAGFVCSYEDKTYLVQIEKNDDDKSTLFTCGTDYYASVPSWWMELPKYGNTELEAFISVCQSVKLEWIVPQENK